VGTEAVPRLAPKARLQWDDARGRHVLLYPEGLVALNETGVAILQLSDGTRSVRGIVTALERRYGVTGIDQDIAAFLDGLAAKGLLTWGS
jgi:pyrroloquinoline quinone biosynthesis protein D